MHAREAYLHKMHPRKAYMQKSHAREAYVQKNARQRGVSNIRPSGMHPSIYIRNVAFVTAVSMKWVLSRVT